LFDGTGGIFFLNNIFYFLKIIFNINILKSSKYIIKNLILNNKKFDRI
jgi:hypothetical protein